MTYEEMLSDSNTWTNHNKEPNDISNKCTHNFIITVLDAIKYSEKEELDNAAE